MHLRDRIKELRRVPANQLLPNPKNWRSHPPAQADALRGLLAEIGFADAVLARETPEGLQILDGHLRAEVASDAILPVLVLDVNDDEADKILATLIPLAAMAGTDTDKLAELLGNLTTTSQAVQELFDQLQAQTERFEAAAIDLPELPTGGSKGIQQMAFTLSDEQVGDITRDLQAAKDAGPFPESGNPNTNGNALARLAEAYLGA